MSVPISATVRNQIRRACELGRLICRAFDGLVWRANTALAIAAGRAAGRTSAESAAFAAKPIRLGRISEDRLAELRATVLAAPELPFSADDHAPGYVFNAYGEALASIFGAGFRFRDLRDPQYAAIGRALRDIADEITQSLGGGWRVANLKSWTTSPRTTDRGPNAWHYDHFPVGTYKLMIYLTKIGPETGTTEVKYADGSTQILEGEAGTYLLFDPSALLHRGVAPCLPDAERTHVELTLVRWLSVDTALAAGGLNTSYPTRPWRRAVVWASPRPDGA